MRRTKNVQEEAMKQTWFLNLTSVVFIGMISSLSAQSSCWGGARGAGMGPLVKGHWCNPAEGAIQTERGIWSWSQDQNPDLSGFENAHQRWVHCCPALLHGTPECWSDTIKVITFQWFSTHNTSSIFYFGANRELPGAHGKGQKHREVPGDILC